MVEESSCNNPRDKVLERFPKTKEQIADISHNMAFLMATLENKFGPFEEAGGFNLEVGSTEKSGDNEDPEKKQ